MANNDLVSNLSFKKTNYNLNKQLKTTHTFRGKYLNLKNQNVKYGKEWHHEKIYIIIQCTSTI